jgi:MscS family membrane protein
MPALLRSVLLSLFALLLAASPLALAQALPGSGGNSAAAAKPAADPYGRDSPRGLANGLIDALAAQDYDRAANYFDLDRVKASSRARYGADAAKRLQSALDAGGSLVPSFALSTDPLGKIDDGLPANQERIGTLPSTAHDPTPLIALSTTADGKTLWRISPQTLAALSTTSAVAEHDTLRDRLPPFLTDTDFAGAPLSDWLVLLVTAVVFYLVIRLIFTVALWLVRRVKPDHENSRAWRLIHAASSPLSLWLTMVLFLQATRSAHVAIVARQIVSRFAGAIALLALAWFLWRLVDVIADLFASRMERTQRFRARSILIFARRAVKIALIVIAVISTLDAFGINVTTGIAALGLGGLAIALGAQKTVENIVGSISVIADEPVRIGDFCRVGDVVGTVEDIGIRSTRIRTNERTRVTIPNGNFSSLQIENYTLRDRYLFNPTLNIVADIDADGIERVLAAVRDALTADFLFEGARATFAGIGKSSYDIDIFAWINVPDFTQSLFLRERLLLDIMRRVEAAGGGFAFPTTSVHLDSAEALKPLFARSPEVLRAAPEEASRAAPPTLSA